MRKKSVEEYIEKIYALGGEKKPVHTGDVAEAMGVSPPSVTEMMHKLATEGYVEYSPYKGVHLTEKGIALARALEKRHRVLAEFLRIIGVDEETAEKDACEIEHHVDPETMKQLSLFVEFIQRSPGNPRWLEHFRHFVRTGELPEECARVKNSGRDQRNR